MKTYLNIEEANKRIKKLRRQLCCCSNNCPLSERTFYTSNIGIDDPDVIVEVTLNVVPLYSNSGIDTQTAIDNLNTNLLGLATFIYDYELGKVKMVSTICADFGFTIFPNGR